MVLACLSPVCAAKILAQINLKLSKKCGKNKKMAQKTPYF